MRDSESPFEFNIPPGMSKSLIPLCVTASQRSAQLQTGNTGSQLELLTYSYID